VTAGCGRGTVQTQWLPDMNATEFYIPTVWRFRAPAERIYDLLSAPQEFVRWWPEVYLAVEDEEAGDAQGVGRRLNLLTKGKLPYRLRWQAEVLEAERPHRMTIRARGDLDGRGEWRFTQDGEWVDARYDWTVYVTQAWMVRLAPLLRPVFVWNHRWAMQRGFEGLARELARVRSA
jgi:uncharacterized protein YndB with AHSA1/START domain